MRLQTLGGPVHQGISDLARMLLHLLECLAMEPLASLRQELMAWMKRLKYETFHDMLQCGELPQQFFHSLCTLEFYIVLPYFMALSGVAYARLFRAGVGSATPSNGSWKRFLRVQNWQ